jgi:hypothetical protein
MDRPELIKALADRHGLQPNVAEQAVNAVLAEITASTLIAGTMQPRLDADNNCHSCENSCSATELAASLTHQ